MSTQRPVVSQIQAELARLEADWHRAARIVVSANVRSAIQAELADGVRSEGEIRRQVEIELSPPYPDHVPIARIEDEEGRRLRARTITALIGPGGYVRVEDVPDAFDHAMESWDTVIFDQQGGYLCHLRIAPPPAEGSLP